LYSFIEILQLLIQKTHNQNNQLAFFNFTARISIMENSSMKHNLILVLMIMTICTYAKLSDAHFDAQIGINIGQQPKTEKIIVVPKYYVKHHDERIYTPDRYHCYPKKMLKYCQTRKGRPLNGVIVNNYNGVTAYETFQNGYQNGETSIYTQDGNLISRSNYKNGIKHGEEIIYYNNGNAEFVMRYKDGALDGHVEQYDINGAILGNLNYKKGWFRDGYCKNEAKKSSMQSRIKNKKYNEIIPCGSSLYE